MSEKLEKLIIVKSKLLKKFAQKETALSNYIYINIR